jgi:hypothetical protein
VEIAATSIDGFLAYWSGLHEVRGEIHSVFQRALNIKTTGGQLISVLSSTGLDGPNTLVADLPQGLDFVAMGLRSGMPVRLDRVGADLGQGALCLRIGRAQKWWPRLAGGAERLDWTRLKSNLRAILKNLPSREFKEGLGGLLYLVDEMVSGHWNEVSGKRLNRLTRSALPGMKDLLAGVLERDEILLERGIHQLVGLGTGLTPSGDDMLMGFAGTLNVVSRRVGSPEMEDVLETIARYLRALKSSTTFVSGNLLSYACAGRVSSPVLSVIRAVMFQKPSQACSAAEDLMRLGGNSGCEILLGILLALSLTPRLGER